MFRVRRVECLYKLGRALTAYAEVAPADETFRQLAFEFVKDKKPIDLAELIAAHTKRFPTAPEVAYWTGEAYFLLGEYAKAAGAFAAFEKSPSKAGTERWRLPERLVRARLRAGDVDGALQHSNGLSPDRTPVALRAALFAGRGDADVVAFLLDAEAQRAGGVAMFYADEDFAREFADAKFAELRAKYPDPRPKSRVKP